MRIFGITAAVLTVCLTLAFQNSWSADPLPEGSAAPSFRLQDQNSKWHSPEDYKGKWLVLYFYPKDDTPGCTTEACNFRDDIMAFRKMGVTILGVSTDDVESHQEFADKHSLPFPLLADTSGDVSAAYAGFKLLGILKLANRKTYLIGPDGTIAKRYDSVDPDKHSAQIMNDLKALM